MRQRRSKFTGLVCASRTLLAYSHFTEIKSQYFFFFKNNAVFFLLILYFVIDVWFWALLELKLRGPHTVSSENKNGAKTLVIQPNRIINKFRRDFKQFRSKKKYEKHNTPPVSDWYKKTSEKTSQDLLSFSVTSYPLRLLWLSSCTMYHFGDKGSKNVCHNRKCFYVANIELHEI